MAQLRICAIAQSPDFSIATSLLKHIPSYAILPSDQHFKEKVVNENGLSDEEYVQWVLAHHEAGHAVVAWALSEQFRDLRISTKRGSVGGPRLKSFHDMSAEGAESEAKVLLGGEFAEHRLLDEEWITEGRMSSEDRRTLEELAAHFHEADPASWIAEMESLTENIVDENWARVVALADELFVRKRLDRNEAERIIADNGYKNPLTIYW